MQGTVEGVRGQLGGMTPSGREATYCLINGVYADQSGIENRRGVDHLGDGGGGSTSGAAALGVEGDGVDPTVGDQERDARKIPAGSAARSAREGAIGGRAESALVLQIGLENLAIHPTKGKRSPSSSPFRTRRAITHTYLPGGCG